MKLVGGEWVHMPFGVEWCDRGESSFLEQGKKLLGPSGSCNLLPGLPCLSTKQASRRLDQLGVVIFQA